MDINLKRARVISRERDDKSGEMRDYGITSPKPKYDGESLKKVKGGEKRHL